MCSASNQHAIMANPAHRSQHKASPFCSLCLPVSVFVILDKGPLRDT
jgi:hypothetical protein